MAHKLSSDNRGIAHLALIIVGVVVLAGVGFAAYRVMNKDKDSSLNNAIQEAAKEECKTNDDKDLCKFFTSWKANEKYRMVSTAADGSKSTFEVDGNKSRVSMTMEGSAYEVITIDKTTYTKAGDTWYKQTIKEPDQDVAKDYKVDFEEPTEEGEAKDKTTYKKVGKESCGNLSCFKYEVVDPTAEAGSHEYIWFDDKDYQLRRTRSETKDGVTETTFEYGNVTVNEPSPVKELGPNQYIIPGQTEPMTMPDMSQFQQ
jgi:hypothetical protein